MKNLNTILLVFTGVLYLSACEAKCRGKNAAKLKRSLKLAISSDDINNRHKAGLRKIFRRKRDTKDEEVIESDKFTAEIKFLQKWNPAMSKKDGSAYRLFQGNVLDAVLEQLNADRRFINSHVLDLKKTSHGILAKVGFHFRKSEHNPISHIRFVVSQGHLSSLKVDKHYFKILKTPAKFSNEDEKGKTSTQQQLMLQHNPSVPKQEPNQNSAAQQAHSESPSVPKQEPNQNSAAQQAHSESPSVPKQEPNQNSAAQQAHSESPSVPKQEPNQNSAAQQAHSESPSATVSSQTQAQPENQLPNTYQTQNQPSTGYPNQPQNEATPQAPTQSQASTQHQGTNGQNQDQSTIANAQAQQSKQPQDQNTAQVATQQQTQAADQVQSQNSAQGQDNAQVTENQYPTNQPQAQYQTEAPAQQQTNTQEQNGAADQTVAESNAQLTQTTPNPSTNVNSDQTQPNPKPAENTPPAQMPSKQDNQKNKESASLAKNDDEENISIKMNQAWFPFLSNHDSPQYKMLAGNLEKGLKSVMEDDKNIKDIKVKDLLQADEGHTAVEFLLKFNGGKEDSTEKLRKIVKTGDIAGISIDASFFKIEDNKKAGGRK